MTLFCVTPVSSFVSVTVAPGTTPPVLSLIVPSMALANWAQASRRSHTTSMAMAQISAPVRILMAFPCGTGTPRDPRGASQSAKSKDRRHRPCGKPVQRDQTNRRGPGKGREC